MTRAPVIRTWLIRTGTAAAGGVAMWASFPPRNLWFFGVVSLGLLYAALAVDRPGVRMGTWCGFVWGAAFWLPLLPWIGVYVGPLPWVALSIVLALYLALFGAIATLTMRLGVAPVWFALCWVTVEWARSSFPFGGFPWGATAFGQVDSPLTSVAALGGVPGLSFVVALTGAGVAAVVILAITRPQAMRMRLSGAVAAVAVGPIAAAAMWPSVHAANTPADRPGSTLTVAAIQGNVPRLGLDFNSQRRAVLDNHVAETLRLADAIRAGTQPRPDVVLWPENASDIDPLDNSDAAEEITAASRAVGAPILVGTLIDNADGRPTNTVLVWDGANGPIGRYDKHIVQPFGEYLPWRSFFRHFSSYADKAGNFRAGTGSTALTVPVTGADGSVRVGVSTCWEVAFDRSARSAVDAGAQFLYVPTNNATFGRTQMTYQQLAMSQIRAVEHGRAVAVAATSGISAIVAPDGHVTSRTEFFAPGTLVSTIPLHVNRTPATRAGAIPQAVLVALTVIGFLVALVRRIKLGEHVRAETSRDEPLTTAVSTGSSGEQT
ncbi:apolipoprotein N-acyltransferase [Williamsia herbipolensis]|uniref:apolipoprotein N-acyltransferase n=1 Tax=Williamsia herbipolensis TaxID=1603258 RepID=UPI0005F82F65|nr:apolipoprotein N-acyltransferase [Williamsia herbipolensis]